MNEKIFTAALQFSERECYQLAGMYLGLAKDYEDLQPDNIAAIQRCEAMAGMFISYMPLSRQNEFREAIGLLLQDQELAKEYDKTGEMATKKVFDLLKNKWQ
jgi:hypothetical protein